LGALYSELNTKRGFPKREIFSHCEERSDVAISYFTSTKRLPHFVRAEGIPMGQ